MKKFNYADEWINPDRPALNNTWNEEDIINSTKSRVQEPSISSIFTAPNIFEKNIKWADAEKKYHDKYLIVTNVSIKDAELYGDIIAILNSQEYNALKKPKPMTPKYQVWEGLSIKAEGLGVLGYYM